MSDKTRFSYDTLSLIAVLGGRLEQAAMLQGLSNASYASAGLTVREPNEARIHANVAKVLLDRMDAGALTRGMALGASLDDDTARRIALDE